ncbi:hypothetical protein ACIRBX_07060 [Kitasatospora sp. NPDC096147]|uniref:hypothetical protein n=1 Tax=Kitasatospora sp. NPDC096147 TaxID=3364093 RepID=UPI00381638FB
MTEPTTDQSTPDAPQPDAARPDAPATVPVEPVTGPGPIAESEPITEPGADLVVAAPRRPRRKVPARWVAAVLVALLGGGAAAAGVLVQERTDLPGLRTPNDGRYVFPELTLPPLPSGKPAPGASTAGGRHHADLRQLLLPAPVGVAAPADRKSCTDYAALSKEPAETRGLLLQNACREAVHRSWTAADGIRTELWLLRFGSEDEANAHYLKMNDHEPKDHPGLEASSEVLDPAMKSGSTVQVSTAKAGGTDEPVTRVVYLQRGDVAGLVLMSSQDGVPGQAFRQVGTGQWAMLGG